MLILYYVTHEVRYTNQVQKTIKSQKENELRCASYPHQPKQISRKYGVQKQSVAFDTHRRDSSQTNAQSEHQNQIEIEIEIETETETESETES